MRNLILGIIVVILFIMFLAPGLNNLIERSLFAWALKFACLKSKNMKLIPRSSKWLWGRTSGDTSDFHLVVGDTLYIVKICSVYKVLTYFTFESAVLWKKYHYHRMAGFGGTSREPKELCLNITFDLAKEKKEAEEKLIGKSSIEHVETVLLFCPKALSYNIKIGEEMITAEPKGDAVFGSLLFEHETFVKIMKQQSKTSKTQEVDDACLTTLKQ